MISVTVAAQGKKQRLVGGHLKVRTYIICGFLYTSALIIIISRFPIDFRIILVHFLKNEENASIVPLQAYGSGRLSIFDLDKTLETGKPRAQM